MGTGDRIGDALLERDGELAELKSALERAAAGTGSATVIVGAPGLGRSRLLAAAAGIAEQAEVEVLSAACRPPEQAFSFGVALQLFEARLAQAGSTEWAGLLSDAAGGAAPLFSGGLSNALTANDTFAVVHGLHRVCSNLAARRPLAICVDDLQWCDEATLRFLLYMSPSIARMPLALVLTHSGAEPGPHRNLISEVTSDPAAHHIELKPLSADAVGAIVRGRLSGRVAASALAAFADVTGGNPRLLDELLAEVEAAEGSKKLSAPGVRDLAPARVARRIDGQLRRIGAGAPGLARAVAVLGDDVELRHAANLAGLDQGEAAAVVDSIVEAGIFDRAERLRFSQPVVRSALLGSLSPVDRGEAHLEAARILGAESASVERIADHLAQARRGGAQWVVDALTAAARRKLAEGAPRAAVTLLQRALEEPPDEQRRPALILELGRAEAIAGEPGAVERLTQALDLIDDPLERAQTLLEVGRTLYYQGRHADAAEAFRQGAAEAGGGDQSLRAQLRVAFAAAAREQLLRESGDPERLTPSPTGGDTRARRVLLAHSAYELALRGKPASEVIKAGETALGDGALLEDETSDGVAYYLACYALTVAERVEVAEAALGAAARDARERGSEIALATASYFRSHALFDLGRVNDAARDARTALAAERYGWRLAKAGAHAVLVHVALETADMEAAERAVEQGERELEASGPLSRSAFLAARGRWLLERNQPRHALLDLLEAGRVLEEAEAPNPAVLPWRELGAAAAWQAEDRDRAESLAEEALTLARRFGAPGAIGSALRALGGVHAGRKGTELLSEAVESLEHSHLLLERARALVELGAALRRAGRLRAARDPLRAGVDLAHRCGARALANRGLTEVAAAGGRPRRAALHGLEALTPRERQVAELAAQGLSNREIANTLFVTVKTVELHLRHTFRKLDLRDRRDLPVELARGGPHRRSGGG